MGLTPELGHLILADVRWRKEPLHGSSEQVSTRVPS